MCCCDVCVCGTQQQLGHPTTADTLLHSIFHLELTPLTPTTTQHIAHSRLLRAAQQSAGYWMLRVECAVKLEQWERAVDWFEQAKTCNAQVSGWVEVVVVWLWVWVWLWCGVVK